MSRPRCVQSSPNDVSSNSTLGSLADQIEQLVLVLNRLAGSLDRIATGVAPATDRGYKNVSETDKALVSEKEMAVALHIKPRTLATYRKKGKLPGCWVRSGRFVRWRVQETLDAWTRGIA